MPTLAEKRVEWIYEHFQAITRLSDRYLAIYAILAVSATAVWLAPSESVELAFIKVDADRHILLGCLVLAGAFVFIAFCGNFDLGEYTLSQLAAELKCEYEDLWMVDTHPTIVDFAKFRRQETAARRRLPSRLANALLYPIVLLGTLAWLTFLWGYESFTSSMSIMDRVPYILAIPTLYTAWHRGGEYLRRRWRTFRSNEKRRTTSPAA